MVFLFSIVIKSIIGNQQKVDTALDFLTYGSKLIVNPGTTANVSDAVHIVLERQISPATQIQWMKAVRKNLPAKHRLTVFPF